MGAYYGRNLRLHPTARGVRASQAYCCLFLTIMLALCYRVPQLSLYFSFLYYQILILGLRWAGSGRTSSRYLFYVHRQKVISIIKVWSIYFWRCSDLMGVPWNALTQMNWPARTEVLQQAYAIQTLRKSSFYLSRWARISWLISVTGVLLFPGEL